MIRLSEITRVFRMGDQEVRALNAVTLDIASGEYVSIMGPSGSGKSTLLNVVGLLDRPDSGRYELDGSNVTDLSETERARVRREKIGFVFQSFHLVPRLTAAENIELPLILEGVTTEQRKSRVEAALDAFDLRDRARHRPAELSGGQRQRVAIARATILRPTALLADEPTGNLDHRIGAEVMALLETLNQAGTTLIVVTHDRELGARAQRHIAMRDGEIVADER
jgi:putative ABC transport system ATP-binding protein